MRAVVLADRVAGLDLAGWRGRIAAFAAGGLSILSMAPFFVWPILWLTLPALLVLMGRAANEAQSAPPRFARWRASAIGRAAEAGWWFGFGYHVFGLFWIVEAFLVEAALFAWLIPITLLLPAGLALFTAAATGFAAWVAPVRSFDRVVALALGLGVTEWLRGHIFTGLPWNVLGYALTPPYMMQGAAYLGIYGLTVVAVMMFAGPPLLWRLGWTRGAVALAMLPLGWLAVQSWAAGDSYRLSLVRGGLVERQGPVIRIVQPSINQREKWRPENQRRIFDDHLELSTTNAAGKEDGAANIALIVWPEAAMPFRPLSQPIALAEIGRMLPPGTTLLAGAIRAAAGERPRAYNTLLGFERGEPARHVATYDKTHLVPFGEYLPFGRVLETFGLRGLAAQFDNFASGPEPRALIDVPGIGKIAPLICYEAIFPSRVIQSTERPRALVIVTNDGWFGNTTGPRQHFHMVRVRAVEEGVPVIRSANNGISGVIDPLGRVVASLALDVRGTIDASLPPSVSSPPLYARVGDMPFAVLSLFLAGWLGLRYRKRHVNGSF
jgi:apolipoprotein N-acyltransferase